MIYSLNANTRGVQTEPDRLCGKAGAVLDPVKALFFDGGHNPPVFDQRGGSVTVICVDAEDVQDLLKRY